MSKCKSEVFSGSICGCTMTKQEKQQDGMCHRCADNIFIELTQNGNHVWYHSDKPKSEVKVVCVE